MQYKGIVAAGHPKTAEAAKLMLEAGGNAFDAVLAAMCAACVVEPALSSLGGGGFLMAHRDGKTVLFDFFAHTPKQRRPQAETDFYPILADFGDAHQEFHIGMGSIATPGLIRGLFIVHAALGSIPLTRIVEPAVEYGRGGVAMNALQGHILQVIGPIFKATPATAAYYQSPVRWGELVAEGEIFRAPELADSFEILAREDERLFYQGEMGQLLLEACSSHGGHLSADDLRAYGVELRTPLRIDYRGVGLCFNPPPSCGGILIAFALKLLEESGFPSDGFGTRAHLRQLAFVMEQTNKARVDSRLHDLESDQQEPTLLSAALLARYRDQVLGRAAALRGTTHVSVIDAVGNAASLTVSNGEGAGYVLPGTGIMMNNMLGEEDINPHGFHGWPLDSRIASMMAPALAFWPGGRIAALGSGGSNRIRTAILQVLSNLIDHRMPLERAVEAPRIHFESGMLNFEAGIDEKASTELAAEFPRHRVWTRSSLFFGGTHCVRVDPARGEAEGAGDPRRGGVWVRV